MAWQDNLRDGSFRGAPFKIEEHEHSFGRRQDVHEYPLKNTPFTEDLGARAGAFRVSCLVIGDGYMAERDALIKACNAEGPGTLVHPYLGSKIVSVGDGRVRESEEEGGAAFFEIEFFDAGGNTAPGISEATQDTALASADAAAAETARSLDSVLVVSGQPEFVRLSALDQLTTAVEGVRETISRVADLGGQLKAEFLDAADALLTGAAELIETPLALAAAAQDLMGQLRDLASTPEAAFAALSDLLDFGPVLPTSTGTTPSRVQEAANVDAIVRLIRRSAACEMVRAMAATNFDSYQAAVAARDAFADRLDGLLTDAGEVDGDDTYAALRDLRLKMVRDVTARGGSLARLFTYTPTESLPALLMAQRLYGDATRDGEIIARNAVVHPGFVPAGFGLEVPTPDSFNG